MSAVFFPSKVLGWFGDKAYGLLKGVKCSFVDYTNMQGVELPVGEPHAPCFAINGGKKVLKAVVKIKSR